MFKTLIVRGIYITYDVANISGGDHDEEKDGPDDFSPQWHMKRVHVRTLDQNCDQPFCGEYDYFHIHII